MSNWGTFVASWIVGLILCIVLMAMKERDKSADRAQKLCLPGMVKSIQHGSSPGMNMVLCTNGKEDWVMSDIGPGK